MLCSGVGLLPLEASCRGIYMNLIDRLHAHSSADEKIMDSNGLRFDGICMGTQVRTGAAQIEGGVHGLVSYEKKRF